MTAYLALLYVARPAFALVQLAALLSGVDLRGFFASAYWLVGAAFLLSQWALRGTTGQSLGQQLMGIVTVDEDTGAPIGKARSIVRSLLHVLDVLPAFAGYARPVVHPRRQTWADTISRSVVMRMDFINSIAVRH